MCALPRRPVDELIIREKNVENGSVIRALSTSVSAGKIQTRRIRIVSEMCVSARNAHRLHVIYIYIYRLGKIQIRMNGVYK